MKFRKRPVVIDAVQFTGDDGNFCAVATFCPVVKFNSDTQGPYAMIATLEGVMVAGIGDWIIKGVKGEFYPCKPDIFAATYEPVERGNGDWSQAMTHPISKGQPIPEDLEMCKCGHPAIDHVNFGRAECDACHECGQFQPVQSDAERIASLTAALAEAQAEKVKLTLELAHYQTKPIREQEAQLGDGSERNLRLDAK
jgi:hypothetical protein